MNEIYKAIEHFERLQKRYTTTHNGKHCELVKTAIAALRAEQERQWISVEDKLPMNNKPVQVYMPKLYMNIQTAFYDRYYGEDDGEWYEQWISNGDVTHWRELPQPPEKKGK